MNKFEQQLDAWLDGRLEGKELERFEASLPEISAAELEAQPEATKLSALLKQHVSPTRLANEDFFNHQLLTQIEGEEDAAVIAHQHFAEPRRSWWSINRLVWTGAVSLAAFAVTTFFVMRGEDNSAGQSAYLTQIINARIIDPDASPDATITMFESKEEKATVVWVEGLRSLPSEYAAK
jgi:hypothetical protein